MGVLDSAKEHFSRHAVRVIEVPEWPDENGKPTLIYFNPPTLSDKSRLRAYIEERGFVESLAYTLILRARTADDKPMFTVEDKHKLMHGVDPDVIADVATRITRPWEASEQTEKK